MASDAMSCSDEIAVRRSPASKAVSMKAEQSALLQTVTQQCLVDIQQSEKLPNMCYSDL
jgi:hypothetical protein